MDITATQIQSKKKVGRLKKTNEPVVEVITKGGLHLIVTKKEGKQHICATAPHRAVGRWIAEKKEPDIEWTELSKSDHLDVRAMSAVLPRWIEITEKFQAYYNKR